MEQKIDITKSKEVTVIQASGDVYYAQREKDKELLPEEKEELTKGYLEFIRNRYKAIPCLDEDVCLTMENYIPLKLGEVKKEERPKERREGETKETRDIDFRIWREEHSLGEIYSLSPVDVERAIQNKKIVVKGDPGSGKTTLTKYIAYSLCSQTNRTQIFTDGQDKKYKEICVNPEKSCPSAFKKRNSYTMDLFPLIIDLKDWAGKGAISLSRYYAKYVLANTGLEEEIEPLIRDWLKSGKCIILCDGLDEVTENKESIIQSLQGLGSGEYRNCHILVTTRIVGYNNELSGWRHYEVMPLNKENIEQYAKDYLKDKSQTFLSALNRTPQMQPLSKNPLLLQILCFVFDKQRLVLPTNRVELYKNALHQMLNLRKPQIPSSIKEKVLQEIAAHFLEGSEAFEEEEVRDIIKDYLERKKERYEPDEVLKEIREKSGLLSQLSDGRYIFLHLTFQEYLCACYIAEGKQDPIRILEPILFNPKFREVIRLVAGMLPKEKAWGFIKFILNQKPLYYNILYQPLLLSGFCIADIPDDKAEPSKEKEIVDKLLRLWKETEFHLLREEINRVFTAMAGTRNGGKIVNNLLGLLEDENSLVRWKAAIALGNLGRADDRVINRLLGLFKDENWLVREEAAIALGNLGRADERVIDGLLGLLKAKDSNVRNTAYSPLQKLAEKRAKETSAMLSPFGSL